MRDQSKLAFAAIITSSIFLLELIGGILFNSLSLISDSFHVIIDISALLISLIALKMALREKHAKNYTYGYHRLEIFAAIINAIILGIAVFFILQEAISRLIVIEPIDAFPALITAIIGISANIFSIIILKERHHEDLNIKSAFYHVIGDTIASVGVIIGTIIIFYTNFYWIDSIIAIFIASILIISIIRIFRPTLRILMQSSNVSIDELTKIFHENDDVKAVHDLHLWHLCSNIGVLTAHVCTIKENIDDLQKIREALRKKLENKFQMQNIHLTIQFEKFGEECSCNLRHKKITQCILDE